MNAADRKRRLDSARQRGAEVLAFIEDNAPVIWPGQVLDHDTDPSGWKAYRLGQVTEILREMIEYAT